MQVRRASLHVLLAACARPELLLPAVRVVPALSDHVLAGQVRSFTHPLRIIAPLTGARFLLLRTELG